MLDFNFPYETTAKYDKPSKTPFVHKIMFLFIFSDVTKTFCRDFVVSIVYLWGLGRVRLIAKGKAR
jgi:hypothetical protein